MACSAVTTGKYRGRVVFKAYGWIGLAILFCEAVFSPAAWGAPGSPAAAQAASQYQSFGRGQTPFDAVVSRRGEVIVLGSGGLLAVLSDDLSAVARRIDVDPSVNFLAAAMGPDGRIRLTDSAGRIWRLDRKLTRVTAEFGDPVGALFSIQYLSDGTGLAVGEFGTVLIRTPDSGRWQPMAFDWAARLPRLAERVGDVSPHLYRVCSAPAGGALVVGEYGVLMQFTHGVWQVQQADGDNATLFACVATDTGQMAVAGQSGVLLVADSAQSPWRAVESGLASDIYELAYYSGQLLAVAQDKLAHGPLGAVRLVAAETTLPNTSWVVRALPLRERLLVVGRQGYLVVDDARRLVGNGPDARVAATSQHANR